MTSSNGNIFRVTGHLCGEFTGRRWIPRTKASDAELWCFLFCQISRHVYKLWYLMGFPRSAPLSKYVLPYIITKKIASYNSNGSFLQVYKSYIQPRLDYGITLYGCSTQKNIDLFQRVQNHAARLIMGNFDYINCRGIDLVKRLNLYTIRERRDYVFTTLMFKAIHGIAPQYLSDRIDMHFDIHGYDTGEAGSMNVYLPAVHKEIYRNSFLYSGGKLWNELSDFVKNSTNIETFKRNYRIYKSLT